MSYSTSFATADGETGKEIGKLFANPFKQFGLETTDPANYVFVAFQLTFAVITAALISGAVADRLKFSAWLVFLPIWVTLSYFPLAHMVWGGGFLSGVENGLSSMLLGNVTADGVTWRRSRRSTTPAAPSSTSTPVWLAWSWRSSSAAGSASARSR